MEFQNQLNRKQKFDIFDGALACLVFVLMEFLFSVFISAIPRNEAINSVLSVILELLFVAASFSIVLFRKKDFFEGTTLKKKVNIKIIGFALAIAAISIVTFSNLTSGFVMLMEKAGYTSVLGETNVSNFGLYVLNIITVCAIPAFCEELLFRGVVLNSFRGLNKWIGIVVSGVMFMLMHGNPDQTVHQLLLGIILGYIAWETRNIWVTMFIHFFNNFIAITITFITQMVGSGNTSSASAEITWANVWTTLLVGVLFCAAGITVIVIITKYIKRQSNNINSANTVEISMKQNSVSTVVEAEVDNVKEETIEQEKPNKYKILATVAGYGVFVVYFVSQWIRWLIHGLGL